MVFYMCGICEKDSNLAGLLELDDIIMERISLSDMRFLYDQLIKVKADANSCDIAYAQAVVDELTPDGIMKGALYACKECVRQLPKVPKKKINAIAGALEEECMETGVHNSDNEDNDVYVSDEDSSDVDEDASDVVYVRRGGVPDYALVNGYFRGRLLCIFLPLITCICHFEIITSSYFLLLI